MSKTTRRITLFLTLICASVGVLSLVQRYYGKKNMTLYTTSGDTNTPVELITTGAVPEASGSSIAEGMKELYSFRDKYGKIDQPGMYTITYDSQKVRLIVQTSNPSDVNKVAAEKWLKDNGYGQIPKFKIAYLTSP